MTEEQTARREIKLRINLEATLDSVKDKEKNAHLVRELLTSGVKIPPKYVRNAIKWFVKSEYYKSNAQESARLGLPPQEAIKFLRGRFSRKYDRVKGLEYAAEVASEAGLNDRSKELYDKAIKLNVRGGCFWRAIEEAKKMGDDAKARELALEHIASESFSKYAYSHAKKHGLEDETNRLYPLAVKELLDEGRFDEASAYLAIFHYTKPNKPDGK